MASPETSHMATSHPSPASWTHQLPAHPRPAAGDDGDAPLEPFHGPPLSPATAAHAAVAAAGGLSRRRAPPTPATAPPPCRRRAGPGYRRFSSATSPGAGSPRPADDDASRSRSKARSPISSDSAARRSASSSTPTAAVPVSRGRLRRGRRSWISIVPSATWVRSAFLSNLPTLVLGSSSTKAQRSGSHHRATRPAEELEQRFGLRTGTVGPRHHHHQGPLVPLGVGDADDGRLEDVGVGHHLVLELHRRDPLAAGLDHVLRPVRDLHEAAVVEPSHVAGAQPPVVEPVGGRVAVVGAGDPRTAHLELAHRLPVGRPGWAVLGHHPELDAGHHPARLGPPVHLLVRARPLRGEGHGTDRDWSRSCPSPGSWPRRSGPGRPP